MIWGYLPGFTPRKTPPRSSKGHVTGFGRGESGMLRAKRILFWILGIRGCRSCRRKPKIRPAETLGWRKTGPKQPEKGVLSRFWQAKTGFWTEVACVGVMGKILRKTQGNPRKRGSDLAILRTLSCCWYQKYPVREARKRRMRGVAMCLTHNSPYLSTKK